MLNQNSESVTNVPVGNNYFSFLETESEVFSSVTYSSLIEKLNEEDASVGVITTTNNKFGEKYKEEDLNKAFIRNIIIWISITLVFVLYFAVTSLVDMSIQKTSILYAKYGCSKSSIN